MPLLLLMVTTRASRARTDAELVKAFQEGDQSVFSLIVERYQDRVYTLCLRWMGNRAVAEEVAQDVFLALYRSLERFRGDAQLKTWIFRVAINHCKNRRLYRKRRHQDRHEPLEGNRDDDDAPVRQLAADQPGTDAHTFAGEAESLVQQALGELDEEQRQIIVLRDVEDLSYEEISEIMDLPRGTVKSRLHRARSQLAAILQRWVGKEDVI